MERKKLPEARYALRLSQPQLAEELEISREIVSLWERKKIFPSPAYRYRLCEYFRKKGIELDFSDPNEDANAPMAADTNEGASTREETDGRVPTEEVPTLSEEDRDETWSGEGLHASMRAEPEVPPEKDEGCVSAVPEEATTKYLDVKTSSPTLEEQDRVSALLEEELYESMVSDSGALLEEATSSDQSSRARPLLTHALSLNNLWRPYTPTLRNFIVSDPARHFWQIAHMDYTVPDEMTTAIQAAIKELYMTTGDKITRRDALCELVSIPMITLGKAHTLHSRRYEEVLRYCTAAFEACWELYQNSDPIGRRHAFECVCTYVPMLETIAHESSRHRKEALDLATRYAILQTLLGWQCANPWKAVGYAQNARVLSRETGDILFRLSAWPKLSWTYLTARQPAKAWETMQEGECVLKEYQRKKRGPSLPDGVISNFYSSYSLAQVSNGISPDAALSIATDSEPTKGCIALVEFAAPSQWLEAAEIYCTNNDPTQAMKWLEKLIDPEALVPRRGVAQSERERIETINVLTDALLQSQKQDMKHIIRTWTAGMKGAKSLRHEVRYQEAIANFERMRGLWPSESAIKKLLPLTSHWSEEEEHEA
jgi:transcriptional regulator with XRE-family HTH domain